MLLEQVAPIIFLPYRWTGLSEAEQAMLCWLELLSGVARARLIACGRSPLLLDTPDALTALRQQAARHHFGADLSADQVARLFIRIDERLHAALLG
jgi:hypothetical protein